ncbi:glycosyltransferase family 32 protein [Butyrivibrio sp. M55]|uniref:glycosyltransferase family 32 protein n=1 Tax=Butyrivibrio sp. M55 TaxID=1855323 RepID=UPI0008E178A6|nr:glycosyltransferase [Butyrivibrio sp. M55]SFU66016.1 Glycosyltransferase sugar-binding region containing DXD motif-containing protein [Butyrivibrio sp. M55]
MNLRTGNYNELAKRIRENNSKVVIYGAGMIGQIVIPYIVETYCLHDYIDCYVDMDKRKIGKHISIGFSEYEIKTPEILDQADSKTVILLTNSKFYPVIEYLESKESLKNSDCYIVSIMQKMEQRSMIPKVIHYCWFGDKEIPVFLKECMESWKEMCPDYEIKRWDENNFDVSKYLFTKQAYEKGKYGFVSDVARLDILYECGGIYMDTDVRLIKPFDDLLFNKGFVGTERWGNINSGGGIGAVAHHPMIKEMLDYRLKFPFIYEDGTLNIETNGLYETTPFVRHGFRVDNTLQIVNNITVYPASVFHPYDYMSCEENIENSTIGIHYFYGGWMDEDDRKNRANTQDKYKVILERMGLN